MFAVGNDPVERERIKMQKRKGKEGGWDLRQKEERSSGPSL